MLRAIDAATAYGSIGGAALALPLLPLSVAGGAGVTGQAPGASGKYRHAVPDGKPGGLCTAPLKFGSNGTVSPPVTGGALAS
jgi:hypothetical protein